MSNNDYFILSICQVLCTLVRLWKNFWEKNPGPTPTEVLLLLIEHLEPHPFLLFPSHFLSPSAFPFAHTAVQVYSDRAITEDACLVVSFHTQAGKLVGSGPEFCVSGVECLEAGGGLSHCFSILCDYRPLKYFRLFPRG